VAVARFDGTIELRRSITGEMVTRLKVEDPSLLVDFTRGSYWCDFSPDDKRIATCGTSGIVTVWRVEFGTLLFTLKGGKAPNDTVRCVCFSPDGALIATTATDLQLWDAHTGTAIQGIVFKQTYPRYVQFSPDSRRLLSANTADSIGVFDIATGRTVMTIPGGFFAKFSSQGKEIVVSYRDGKNVILDAEDGALIRRLDFPFLEPKNSIAAQFSPDDRHVITTELGPFFRVWNAKSGKRIAAVRAKGQITLVSISRDGNRLVGFGDDYVGVFRRNRPEEWWGMFWLPGFWGMVMCGGLIVGNVVRNRRRVKSEALKKN